MLRFSVYIDYTNYAEQYLPAESTVCKTEENNDKTGSTGATFP